MADIQVTCITKPHPQSPHEHITKVGIEAKSNSFFVLDPKTGKRADIGVVRATGHAPYLRTYADGVWNDNLLSLDQCPL